MKVQRGDVWLVNLEPTVGAEIRKTRPAVVVSSDTVASLPVRLVAPITEWKEHFARNLWHVKIVPDSANGLAKVSAVDTLQLRSVDLQRFVRRLGHVSLATLRPIIEGIAIVIEY